MKVLLVVPPRPRSQALQIMPPLGLGYLATSLRRGNHEVRILDATLQRTDAGAFAALIRSFNPEIVGLSMFSADFHTVNDYSLLVKSLSPKTTVVVGGIHPSSEPQETLRQLTAVDYGFKGEAEDGLRQLAEMLTQGSVPGQAIQEIAGLIWRQDGSIRVNPQYFPEQLDALGFPAWDLINPLWYQASPPTLFVRQRPFAPIMVSRGCPYQCTFCGGGNVTGKKMRSRSLGQVIAEIEFLRRNYGVRELHIEDDNFTFDREFVQGFCGELLKKKMGLSWTMPNGVRLNTLDKETLALMRRAGCYLIIVGIESGSPRILSHMKKGLTVGLIEEKVRLIKEAGIAVHGFFMLGYPQETMEDITMTLQLALRLELIGAHFSNFHPLPGTEIARQLSEAGALGAFNLDAHKLSFATVVYTPPGISSGQLKGMQRYMLRRFYLRPRIIGYYLKALADPRMWGPFLHKAGTYLYSR